MDKQFEWSGDLLLHVKESLKQGDFEIMAKLFRLEDGTVINLDRLTTIEKNAHGDIIINFDEQYHAIESHNQPTYQQVSAWMESIELLGDAEDSRRDVMEHYLGGE